MVKKSYGGRAACTSSSQLSESEPRQNFRLGDITWVKHDGSSWWPAQVIDEASVSSKPKRNTSFDALVRQYGTCQYFYVDPWKSNMEFEMILKEENKTAMEAFHEVLQKELSHFKSPSDHDEEAVTTKAKTSAKKVKKQDGSKRSGHGGVKGLSTTESPGDGREHQYSTKRHQEVRSNAKTGVAVREGRKQKGAKQASQLDKGHAIDRALSEDSAEDLRDKAHKQASIVRDTKGRKMAQSGTSVIRKEGLRQSGRTNVREYLDAAEDSTSELHDASASETTEARDITSVNRSWHKNGSTVDRTHLEIKAMVRDILLGDIIARQHAAEMAYVDEVIFGICDATEKIVLHGTTPDTEGGLSIKRTAGGMESDSSNVTKKPRKGEVANLENGDCQNTKRNNSTGNKSNSSHSMGAAMEGSEQRNTRAKSRLCRA
uniref:Uncharacterized protein n=1 Tax=Avena sativa TaxID=4498 RepID=A0ACD5V6D3_AVESA